MGERCRCGAELRPGLHFCMGCGADRAPEPAGSRSPGPDPTPVYRPTAPASWSAPAPGRASSPVPASASMPSTPIGPAAVPAPVAPVAPWSPGPVLVIVSVVLVVVLSAAAVVFTLRPELLLGQPAATVAPAAAPAAQPFMPAVAPSATDELNDQVDSDRARVESVTGWWVPQLSSKRPGTVDGGIRYDDTAILSHYRGLAAQYPGSALLWSGEWPVYKNDDYWVVIVAQPFSTPAQANAWCDAQGFGAGDCLAKNLSHTGGPAGTTVNR